MLMVAYECGNLELLETVIREYSLHKALNQKNKRGDNLILRSIKDQNENLSHFLMTNPHIDLNCKDEVIYRERGSFILTFFKRQINPNE